MRKSLPKTIDIADRCCLERTGIEIDLEVARNVCQGHTSSHSQLYKNMQKHSNDRLQGTLDLLVLKTLESRGPMHGYGITAHIEQASKEILRLEEGSLYPALHRMTQSGWLRSEWGVSENNRRARYYSITASGRRQLAGEEKSWSELTGAVARVLRFT
jgi:PadR family transcriptional regulator, regulatory protein PadR